MDKPVLYTDGCLTELKEKLEKSYGLEVVVRNDEEWNISYITRVIMAPETMVLVINFMSEKSIAEMALASFMCKPILVTSRSIEEYPSIKDLATDIDLGCTLLNNKTSFTTWFEYKFGSKR